MDEVMYSVSSIFRIRRKKGLELISIDKGRHWQMMKKELTDIKGIMKYEQKNEVVQGK